MKVLKEYLEILIKTLSSQQKNKLKNRLDDLISVYPFNECEYIIASLWIQFLNFDSSGFFS